MTTMLLALACLIPTLLAVALSVANVRTCRRDEPSNPEDS